jgi:predicted  nucleic acid-binding Zn-ribbon protein
MAARSRHERLRRIDALVADGHSLADACALDGLTEGIYKAWVTLEQSHKEKGSRKANRKNSPVPFGKDVDQLTEAPAPELAEDADARTLPVSARNDVAAAAPPPAGILKDQSSAESRAAVIAGTSGSTGPAVTVAFGSRAASSSGFETRPEGMSEAMVAARSAAAGRAAVPPSAGPGGGRARRWRLIALAACLLAGPSIAIVAAYFLAHSARTASDESLARHDASLLSLQQRGATTDAVVEGSRREAGGLRGDLADLQARVADLSNRRSEMVSQVEAVRQAAARHDANLGQLERRLGAMQGLRDSERERERVSFMAEIDGLRRQLGGGRLELAKLDERLSKSIGSLGPLTTSLGRQQADLAGQVQSLRQEVSSSRASLSRLEAQVETVVRRASRDDGRSDDLETGSVTRSGPAAPESGSAGRGIELPRSVTPRVILRVARNRAAAREKATTLEQALQAQGLVVTKASGPPLKVRSNSVIYYYAEDRSSAERIAAGVPSSTIVQRQFSEDDSLPRPGTIEVAIMQ